MIQEKGNGATLFLHGLNAALVSSAATMATNWQTWRPDRGRCFKTYGIVIVLFMDMVSQCVNGMVHIYTSFFFLRVRHDFI